VAIAAMTVTTGGGPAGDLRIGSRATATFVAMSDEQSFAEVEAEYERASADLLAAVESMKDRLPADTIAVLRRDLEVIDKARAEVRAALAADPGNPGLTRLLASTHQHRLDLLQRVVRLSS
jgi:hypothetical protein